MIKALAVASMVLVSTPVLAQGFDEARLPRLKEFVEVFQANNCHLTTKGAGAISDQALFGLFSAVGISPVDVSDYVSALVDNEVATVDPTTGGITVLPPLCTREVSE